MTGQPPKCPSSKSPALITLRENLEGAIPCEIATCDSAGTPNVSVISDVHFVDDHHVAISYQFFSKTRANILANPQAVVELMHPATGAIHRLHLKYLRTEYEGPLFEAMRAKLAGIASHEGMSGVFRLLGSDIYHVVEIEAVRAALIPPPARWRNPLPALRNACARLGEAQDLDGLIAALMAALRIDFDIQHMMLLMTDDTCPDRLFTVATDGYAESGVGAEILFGQGVVGVAAREKTPVRITHATREYLYGKAVREAMRESPLAAQLETEIPLPGLGDSRSQMAVPILMGRTLLGVIYVESPLDGRFCYDEEDALMTLARYMALILQTVRATPDLDNDLAVGAGEAAPVGGTLTIRHYRADDSIFIDDDYLIKGVAGAILWKLLRDNAANGRVVFSNKELRLSPDIRLPEFAENLEARIILLRRRLAERCPDLGLEKEGRGRFRLRLDRPLALEDQERPN